LKAFIPNDAYIIIELCMEFSNVVKNPYYWSHDEEKKLMDLWSK